MEISSIGQENLVSLQQALQIEVMKKSMGRDAMTAMTLIQGMQATNAKLMEYSVTPHKGGNIDVRV